MAVVVSANFRTHMIGANPSNLVFTVDDLS